MASTLSHKNTTKPGAKLGESAQLQSGLEAEGAKNTLSLSPHKEATKIFEGTPLFHNGWFCKQCDCVTEHRNVQGREVCLECGFALGKPKPVVAAQQRDYCLKNKDRLAAQQRDYRLKNKDRLTAQKRDYYLKNKDRLTAQKRDYRLKNKDRLTAQQRDYYLKNKDRLTAQKRDYRLKNKDKINSYQREWKIKRKITALKMEASR